MNQRSWQTIVVLVATIFLFNALQCDCAAFRLKHYNIQKPMNRGERRLIHGSSPIHFINPFIPAPPPMHSFDSYFVPPMPMNKPAMSSIYRLPLQLLNNGKPQKVLHVMPKKNPHFLELFPHASSKIIHLPLKFVSNGKPIGIYLKEQSYNYI
ncbi:uncharacterized protein NPIL_233181 [Nephila pilipes]|uniref:Uncharacterized protein n=1 Tax=Nephila pilipes TaxID=299642 RepID=A0A8X6Q256_NEPPI|nr:uncharacterized protein NPIL_233181 [Nephila pilipes]